MTTFKIQRYDPSRDQKPYFRAYEVPVETGMTILDCLFFIKENLDATVSFRASCRMGICGSCAIYINGRSRLACETQAKSLRATTIEIRPLPNYELIKDLVVDLTPLFQKHRAVKPWIIAEETGHDPGGYQHTGHNHDGHPHSGHGQPAGEHLQRPGQLEQYLQFAYCLKCGICLSACPTMATDQEFLGPQALAQAFRYNSDTRDEGGKERLRITDTLHGLWRCHMAGACAEACPKGVDPALAIQLMKQEAIFGKKRVAAKIAGVPENVAPRPGIPRAPELTVKR